MDIQWKELYTPQLEPREARGILRNRGFQARVVIEGEMMLIEEHQFNKAVSTLNNAGFMTRQGETVDAAYVDSIA